MEIIMQEKEYDKIGELIQTIKDEANLYQDYISPKFQCGMNELITLLEGASKLLRKAVALELYKGVEEKYVHKAVYLLSAIINLTHEVCYLEELEKYVIDSNKLEKNTKYFLYYQIKSLMFRFKTLETEQTKILKWKLLQQVVNEFRKALECDLSPIPIRDRDENCIVVLAEQILETHHAPTKIAYDRCKAIITNMKKKTLLINTAEVLSERGEIPFIYVSRASYLNDMLQQEECYWENVTIPYFQCENNMPNIETINALVQAIRNMRPIWIVSIGGSSIVANILNDMIPVLTVGLGPSDLEATMTKYQTLARDLVEEDFRIMKSVDKRESHVIRSIFTSGLKKQTEHLTRMELGLPQNKFIMVTIGMRLDDEITDEFLEFLEETIDDNALFLFLGELKHYKDIIQRYPNLKEKIINFEPCDDILSRVECCDLYVNPNRKGGGTSGVGALFKGKPVVTLNYGDVAVNAGEDFIAESYDEMRQLIHRYQYDLEFYNSQAKKAKERAEILLNTEKEFLKTIQEMERRESEENIRTQVTKNHKSL